MEEKLKPCPFCGKKDLSIQGETEWGVYFILCLDCGGEGPAADGDKELAIKRWNNRASKQLELF